MRVWVDITNSPHVPFFRPLLALLEERGHERDGDAREYAQTLELLDQAGIAHEVSGRHTAVRERDGQGAGRWPAGCARCAGSRGDAASISHSPTRRTSSR